MFLKAMILLSSLWLSFPGMVAAQSQSVQIEMIDELKLIGDYYTPSEISDEGAAAVLLAHPYFSTRAAWRPLIAPLVEAGYIVLNVDLRGHGETGGEFVWETAVSDMQTVLDWLQAQPTVRAESTATLGANMGGNLALIGCGNDAECRSAIAISPGTTGCADCTAADKLFGESFETMTTAAIKDGLKRRSTLLVASHFDSESRQQISDGLALARGEINVRFYPATYSGTQFIADNTPTQGKVTALIVAWLDENLASE